MTQPFGQHAHKGIGEQVGVLNALLDFLSGDEGAGEVLEHDDRGRTDRVVEQRHLAEEVAALQRIQILPDFDKISTLPSLMR